jgi:hypothetical protein
MNYDSANKFKCLLNTENVRRTLREDTDDKKEGKTNEMSGVIRWKLRYKRASIGGASPIGTCMYGNGNTYGKGKASLTENPDM